MQRGTFQWMKSVNKTIVLNKIRKSAPISRAQIAKETELTPPTVSSIVKELLGQGLIMESESGDSSGGRKPTMLRVCHEAFFVIALDAGPDRVDCVVSDLGGNVVKRSSDRIDLPTTEDAFLDQLKKSIADIIEEAKLDLDKTLGIGLAMHGVVNVETGTSLYAPNLNLTDIPIKARLEEAFELEVIVENDARAMALGEAWFGNHLESDSMLVINFGRGVGAGMIVNGELYHGAQDIAGEVGHMTIDMNGNVCDCGNKGCLQTFATGEAIGRRAEANGEVDESDAAMTGEETERRAGAKSDMAMTGEEPECRAGADKSDTAMTGEMVYKRADAGEAHYVRVLEDTGDIIGIALTNLIHIMNPEKIVLGGGVMNAKKFLLPHIKETIANQALTADAKQTAIAVSELGDDATLLGAVSLFLVEVFALK